MRVLVCGGRKYDKRDRVFTALDRIHFEVGITVLIHGAAKGADTLGKEWAQERGIPDWPYPIELGEGGYARNRRMFKASEPELVVHFPGGNGTRHMRQVADKAGCPTRGGLLKHFDLTPRML